MKKENKEKIFTPIHNMPPPLYGPPDVLKELKKETEEKTFFVEENIHPCVYGPPKRTEKHLIKNGNKKTKKNFIQGLLKKK